MELVIVSLNILLEHNNLIQIIIYREVPNMAKKNKKDEVVVRRNGNGFTLKKEVAKCVQLCTDEGYEKYLKKMKKNDISKKKAAKLFYDDIISDYLSEVIETVVRYGKIDEVKKAKLPIYDFLVREDFAKRFNKYLDKVENGDLEPIDNLQLFPALVRDIITTITQINATNKANAKEGETPVQINVDFSNLVAINQRILKKKLKKMKKNGIPEDIAMDVLSVIPDSKMLKNTQMSLFRIRELITLLYEEAVTKEVNFPTLMQLLLPDDMAVVQQLVIFLLLERKNKFNSFNENQQKLFVNINKWIFDLLEICTDSFRMDCFTEYCKIRKKDLDANNDGDRRYFLKSLPEAEYPKTAATIKKFIEKNADYEQFC